MGLDQYLKKKIYIGAYFDFRDVEAVVDISIAGEKVQVNPNRLSMIEERVGYWRKANQIHKWFVENVQDGKDDCGEYYVPLEKLKNLLSLCKEVKENKEKAPEILPTQQGFFYGTTEYDEWYDGDINDTIIMIEEILKEEESGAGGDYYYTSSW